MRTEKALRGLKAAVSILISAQIAFGTQVAMASETKAQPRPIPAVNAQIENDNPFMDEFAKAKINPEAMQLRFSTTDSYLDQHPFFLGLQSWRQMSTASAPDETYFRRTTSGIEVTIPGTTSVLSVNVPLLPVAATDDFYFFSLSQESDLFKKAAGNEEPGEGLFFINRKDLLGRALNKQPVPVHFLPLPGHGWTGPIDSQEIPNLGILAIASREGVALPLELKDVEMAMKAQQINLLLATAFTVKSYGVASYADVKTILPARGTTAGFGMFFTGLNLQDPSRSQWKVASNEMNSELMKWMTASMNRFPLLKSLMPEQAHASLDAALVERLVWVGSILGAMLMTSVVLKYKHSAVRRKIHSLREGAEPTTALRKAGREVKEWFDVFANVTTTAGQIPAVVVGNAIELALDRYMPSLAAGDHTLIRKFLNNTFYWWRESMSSTPVNAKTFYLGALVLGSVDTSLVVLQAFVLVPWMSIGVMPYLNDFWREKVYNTFVADTTSAKDIAMNDSVRNGIAYGEKGASHYSSDSRAQLYDPVMKEIKALMVAEGKNPDDPANKSDLKKRVETKIDMLMKQRGLPAQDHIIFDANTLFAKIPQTLGYSLEGIEATESFILAKRFTLTVNALNRALDIARKQARLNPSRATLDALAILEETASKMSFVKNGIGKGKEGLQAAREVRKQLMLLSYEGPMTWATKFVPTAWNDRYSSEGAQGAALMFRQALYSYLSQDSVASLDPTEFVKFGEIAKAKTIEQMIQERAAYARLPKEEATARLLAEHEFELNTRVQLKIAEMAREHAEEVKALEYKPAKLSWMERREQNRAAQYASDRMTELAMNSSTAPAPQSEEHKRQWIKFYNEGMARQVGLRFGKSLDPRYEALMRSIEEEADKATISQLENDKGLKAYLAKASIYERTKIEASVYSANYLRIYKSATTEEEKLNAKDTQQLGRFQAFRQKSRVINSKVLTGITRVIESTMNDQAVGTGWFNFFSRNVPFFQDMWDAHARLVKMAIPYLTVMYLWNTYAWHVTFTGGTWLLFVVFSAATMSSPNYTLARTFRMLGLKPMGGTLSKIIYGIPFSFATFFGMFPMMLLKPEADSFVGSIRDPIMGAIAQLTPENWMAAAGAAVGATGITKLLNWRKREKGPKDPDAVRAELKIGPPMGSCQLAFSK